MHSVSSFLSAAFECHTYACVHTHTHTHTHTRTLQFNMASKHSGKPTSAPPHLKLPQHCFWNTHTHSLSHTHTCTHTHTRPTPQHHPITTTCTFKDSLDEDGQVSARRSLASFQAEPHPGGPLQHDDVIHPRCHLHCRRGRRGGGGCD